VVPAITVKEREREGEGGREGGREGEILLANGVHRECATSLFAPFALLDEVVERSRAGRKETNGVRGIASCVQEPALPDAEEGSVWTFRTLLLLRTFLLLLLLLLRRYIFLPFKPLAYCDSSCSLGASPADIVNKSSSSSSSIEGWG